jgi:GAF domain-containing protein
VTGAERDAETGMPALFQRLFSEDSSLIDSLQGVANAGCSLLNGCSAASITLIEAGRPVTVAATDDTAVALDQAQYDDGDGPCLAAAREERLISIEDTSDVPEWPRFAKAATEVGVSSSLSIPLSLPGTTYGGLNLYGGDPAAFDEHDQEVGTAFASQAASVVMNALAFWTAHEQAANLTQAMEHRAVIEQAKGIIMARSACTPDEAFDVLRRASQRENRKLRDLATDLVERASSARPNEQT